VYREIMYQRRTNHPSVLPLLSVWRLGNDRDIVMVLPFMDTDLHVALRSGLVVKPAQKAFVMYQLIAALAYLHASGLVHRDIKPLNLLLNEACKLRVCDFGLVRGTEATPPSTEMLTATDQVGSRWYRAPELMLGTTRYSASVDLWSCGCVLAEMYTGKVLLPGSSNTNQLQRIFEVTGLPTEEDFSSFHCDEAAAAVAALPSIAQKSLAKLVPRTPETTLDLIRKLLTLHPGRRLDAVASIDHP